MDPSKWHQLISCKYLNPSKWCQWLVVSIWIPKNDVSDYLNMSIINTNYLQSNNLSFLNMVTLWSVWKVWDIKRHLLLTVSRFGHKVGQIHSKWDKSRNPPFGDHLTNFGLIFGDRASASCQLVLSHFPIILISIKV